jgi:polysaccharide export outer membrane protein
MARVTLLLLTMLCQLSAQTFVGSKASSPGKTGTSLHTAPAIPADETAYLIGPEDVLQINVWKESDISTSVPVRPDGKISLPLLNDLQAAGLTPLQLSAEITTQLKQFIAAPHVTVIVTAMNSRRAYVMGQVARQGAVPLVSNLTVLQALSAAGGPAQFANCKKIYVLRTENGKQLRLAFNYDAVIKGRNPEQNIILKPGDTVIVP